MGELCSNADMVKEQGEVLKCVWSSAHSPLTPQHCETVSERDLCSIPQQGNCSFHWKESSLQCVSEMGFFFQSEPGCDHQVELVAGGKPRGVVSPQTSVREAE